MELHKSNNTIAASSRLVRTSSAVLLAGPRIGATTMRLSRPPSTSTCSPTTTGRPLASTPTGGAPAPSGSPSAGASPRRRSLGMYVAGRRTPTTTRSASEMELSRVIFVSRLASVRVSYGSSACSR
ncbi:hypothetical protein PSTG_00163 [Puccinia striiformis f. sp. tritici PST-78]|uniref:Uncharacterized protein n=1 Tax=Puccinia striiformis f. sp. tritici PST-78 TaxID=1165861 RepID=A0A0L0W6F3_9BASI|nr:hypothetical protein PSTG_00163 [Puccinia striiformis f. sp. tritici PST-78]